MSSLGKARDLRQLQRLYALRETRALDAISEQQKELERVQGRLFEQSSLIASLEAQLADLHNMRAVEAIHLLSATSLRDESDRRHMLTQELEMEIFYLPGFESDVEEAQAELTVRRRLWSQIGHQIRALEKLMEKQTFDSHRSQGRIEDALQDDRTQVVTR